MHGSEYRGAEREYRFSGNIGSDNRLKIVPVIVNRSVPILPVGCAEVESDASRVSGFYSEDSVLNQQTVQRK